MGLSPLRAGSGIKWFWRSLAQHQKIQDPRVVLQIFFDFFDFLANNRLVTETNLFNERLKSVRDKVVTKHEQRFRGECAHLR